MKTRQKSKPFFFLFILVSLFVHGQQLRGIIVDQKANSAIPGAAVYWEKSSSGTATDTAGKFSIAWPDSFPATLIVRFTGYKPKGIVFAGSAPQYIRVGLESSDTLNTVVISERIPASMFAFMDPILMEQLNQRSLLKAACCNLSESFETNPSVDAAVTDAVSGAKKIQLLGLDGVYSQILFENLPLIHGLSSSYGLSFIPGTWVKSILITKGTGSVVNGYESISGQLNIDLLKPLENEDRLYTNLYANQRGRYEANVQLNRKFNDNFGTSLFLHASTMQQRNDMNHDGFLDMPLFTQYNLMNRWQWQKPGKVVGMTGVHFVSDDKQGGQFMYDKSRDYGTTNFYGVGIKNTQAEFFNKTGFIFNAPGRSLGTMFSARMHDENMYFGQKTYDGKQRSLYANLIWQDIIGNTNHVYKAGLSFILDQYNEAYNDSAFHRTEIVPGIFAEYTGHLTSKFTVVAGMRGDLHNIAGFEFTPRLHMKYDLTPKTAIRVSGGRAFRMANIFPENSAVFASSRQVIISGPLKAEVAWNYGGSVQQKFSFMKNDATFIVDFFRTDFMNQVIMDMETPGLLKFYNLNGRSFANSFQADLSLMPFKRFDVRVAYKFYDVEATYSGNLKQRPLVARNRAFVNLAYALPYDKWTFDFTAKWIGGSRLPESFATPVQLKSDPFWVLSTQVAKKFPHFDVYAGVENLLNFTQKNPIIGAEDPFGPHFDASLVYAPTDGRVIYGGLRFKL